MIHRNSLVGEKLDVAGLNEITVLVDRSETELTEVAMNSWCPGLDGPPHSHERKEQLFLVTGGRGEVRIGADPFPAERGGFFYVPAGVVHQTINLERDSRLEYFLFNAFLDTDKEGHASFADHIAKVKHIRRQQAERQSESPNPSPTSPGPRARGKWVATQAIGAGRTLLLDRRETERCEAWLVQLPPQGESPRVADDAAEQTLFILHGSGRITVDEKGQDLSAGDVVFVPRGATWDGVAAAEGLRFVAFATVVRR
jgi:quercetin dioxygenase-like cupin family protein